MPFETAFKVTCYPINPAYKPRVEILRDADPKLARKKAEDFAEKMKEESWMTGKTDIVECGLEALNGPVATFMEAQRVFDKSVDDLVKNILGPAFEVPAPFGEGTFSCHTERNLAGTYFIEGIWSGPGAEEDPCGTWNFEISIYPDDWHENTVTVEWRGKGLYAETTIDPDDVREAVTRMVKYASDHKDEPVKGMRPV